MLDIKGLKVSYGVIPVLHGIDLRVNQGELVALLGSNGAGKTSLLNSISGMLKPVSGDITMDGETLTGKKPHEVVAHGVVQIPEGRKIFPYFTVYENLLMGACRSGAWGKREEVLQKVYEMFPILEERKEQRASTMSGGQQQMLVIARGLMSQPKLLMIDEPSLGLSPAIMDQIYEVISTFVQQGITVLLSEQNVQVALSIADRAYVLQDGEVVLEGDSTELMGNQLVKEAYMGI